MDPILPVSHSEAIGRDGSGFVSRRGLNVAWACEAECELKRLRRRTVVAGNSAGAEAGPFPALYSNAASKWCGTCPGGPHLQ